MGRDWRRSYAISFRKYCRTRSVKLVCILVLLWVSEVEAVRRNRFTTFVLHNFSKKENICPERFYFFWHWQYFCFVFFFTFFWLKEMYPIDLQPAIREWWRQFSPAFVHVDGRMERNHRECKPSHFERNNISLSTLFTGFGTLELSVIYPYSYTFFV